MCKPLPPLCALLSLGACVGDIPTGGEGAPTSGAPTAPGMTGPGPGVPTPPGVIPPPSARPPAAAVPTTRVARLSHRQWESSVRDLLRLQAAPGLSARFASDSVGTFDNDGAALAVTDNLRADYQTAAEALAVKVARDPAALGHLLPANAPGDARGRGAALITELGRRAYRRPLDDQEIAGYTALFNQGPALLPGVDPFAAGAQLIIEGMLQSPHFLYRTELSTGPGRTRLSDYEIAAKLSFALAGTMPDDALFAAAAAAGLRTNDQVMAQAQRLVEQGGEPAGTFHEALFDLGALATDVDKDPRSYPEFKPAWRDSIRKEADLFLAEIFKSNRGLADLLTAPFTFADATLAPLYGVAAPAAGSFARIDLDPKQRAGFLTQIGFLARSGSSESDPILRGAFVNRRILCVILEPPPGATEMVTQPPATARTNRERVTALTSAPMCATCHQAFVNPAGFAFESFDALGRYRTTDNGQPIDTADSYGFVSGPKSFKNAVEWSRVLAESEEAHDCYARGWVTYLQGRRLAPEDEPFVKWLAGRSRQAASLRALALTVVTDDSFLTRLP